jgi:ribosome biogenesis GTPase
LTSEGIEALGFSAEWEAAFAAATRDIPGLSPARVVLEHGKYLRVHDGTTEHLAVAAGRLRHDAGTAAELPTVGDWVAIQKAPPDEKGKAPLAQIRRVLPRRSRFSRRRAGPRAEEQVVAANVDVVLLMMGLDGDFNPRRLERFLSLAHVSGARPVVALNKADMALDLPAQRAAVAAVAGAAPVVVMSLREPEGHAPVLPFIGERPAQTVALLGSSGVGKSTLINRLSGADVQRTGEVRAGDGRGRHTTSYAQLFRLPQGALCIDTPGLREIQLWEAEPRLANTFPDIDALAATCRFTDCRHGEGQPDCAVQTALATGALPAERWSSFTKLRAELEAGATTRSEGRRPRRGKSR